MKYVTVKRISEVTGIKEKTLYDWANKGKIPSRKIEKLIRFDEEEIMAWIESKKVASEEKKIDKLMRSIYSKTKGRPSRLGKKVS